MDNRKKRRLTVLMPLENEELLKKYFPNIHFGMRYAFEAFSNILQNSLADLKNIFTKEELEIIVNVFRDVKLEPSLAGFQIQERVKRSVPRNSSLLKKISTLSLPQKIALEIWAAGYWTCKAAGNRPPPNRKRGLPRRKTVEPS
jgi:hypothetical protein